MKKLFGAIVASAMLVLSAPAFAEELMELTFGNTVTVADADGMVLVTYFFDDDGTFSMTDAAGTATDGTWALDGSNLCLTVGENSSCSEIDDRNVGDSWDDTDEAGNTVTISIVGGR